MMKLKILLVLLFATSLCQAQTKVIAHKSHSGSRQSFSKAYQKDLFDLNRSNFGLPGNVNITVLDSVIAVSDSVTILKWRKANSCHPFGTTYKDLKESDFSFKSDTLINHEVLNRKNTISSIKDCGRACYPMAFVHPIDRIVFIGFKD